MLLGPNSLPPGQAKVESQTKNVGARAVFWFPNSLPLGQARVESLNKDAALQAFSGFSIRSHQGKPWW